MSNIGIFGGGQLAKMICIEGYKMGLDFNIYDPNPMACSKSLANNFYVNDFLDEPKITEFIKENDVFTYEFENINPSLLEKYTDKIPQGIDALKLLQDRFTEKEFINKLDGVKTVPYVLASSEEKMDVPFIIKTRRNGYDGKGQFLITDLADLKQEMLTDDYIIEKYIEGIEEYSIVMGRSTTGEIKSYEPIKNIHKKGILHQSTFSFDLDKSIKEKMIEKTRMIIEKLNYSGVLCVEFFVKNNEVFVNEVAPRVHNSGHLTIEASNVSQFKLHLQCILGMKLPDILCRKNYYMINILGHDLKNIEDIKNAELLKNCNVHIYGKKSYAKNRKVGHITFENKDNLLNKVKDIVVGGVE